MRILVADDHTVIRKGLKQILLEAYPAVYIEEATDAETVINKIMTGSWDVVISDLSMPGRSGLDVLQYVKQNNIKTPVLILSIHPEEQYAIRVLKAGAAGYLSKDAAQDELVAAVQRVLQGRKYVSSSIAEKLVTELDQPNSAKSPHELLSDREFDVFMLLASGQSITEIADRLSISITTVSTNRSRILAKMNLKTNADITRYAIEHKL
jgi:DNA-binding NarL/FixJ family response regulator